jgi:glycosyltransferase involved in cell wall biosynthesis
LSVSVTIPNYNYGRFLSRCLASVSAQTVPANEIIVVDSGSTDESREIAGEWPGVRLIEIGRAVIGKVKNTGHRAARSTYVINLDSDDWIEPEYIERTLTYMSDGVGIVCTAMRWPDGHVEHPSPPFTAARCALGNPLFSCSLVRREAWASVGGYDERPDGEIYDDWDLWWRIIAAGWKVATLPEPLFHYCWHPDNRTATISPERDRLNRDNMLRKNLPRS